MSDEALERAFYEVAGQRRLLAERAREEVDRAVARAAKEGVSLPPWRAAFVRGLMNRAEVDSCLAEAGKRVAASSLPELGTSAEDEGQDFRLGRLAVDCGLIDEQELADALELKKKRRRTGEVKVGDALVEIGAIRPSQRDALLLLQETATHREPRAGGEPPLAADLRFGKIALENDLVGARDLDAAIAEQRGLAKKGSPQPIGDILVESGAMLPEARDLVLELQERRSTRVAARPAEGDDGEAKGDPDALGRIIVENWLATEKQLAECLRLQRDLDAKGVHRRLGDLLVLKGYIDRGAIETLLRAQEVRRQVTRRRKRRIFSRSEESENPLTVLAAIVVAAILIASYALSTGGLPAAAEEPERGGASASDGRREPPR